jgi:D-alanine-D-alanine ligase-like ATP-grasp enzyme
LKLALTYNTKKEISNAEKVSEASVNNSEAGKYINKELVENYPERVDDTFAEWDSMETIDAVKTALETGGHKVSLVEANPDAFEKLKDINPEFVYNVAEGFYGASRESQIPALLEMLNLNFTGSDSITIGICHDKSRCKFRIQSIF